MHEEILLSQLEELADKLEILVRDENIIVEESSTTGGLCRIEGKFVLILNSKATVKEKIQVMIKSLQQFDISDVYVKPVIRELLEEREKGKSDFEPRPGEVLSHFIPIYPCIKILKL